MQVQAGMDTNSLNHRQRRFAVEYAYNGGNGTQAAIQAGYAEAGADVTASRLLDDPRVMALVEEHREHIQRRTEITADRVLAEVHAMATVNFADLVDPDGNLRPLHTLPRHVSAAITGMKVTIKHQPGQSLDQPLPIERVHDIKLDKGAALDKLMRHLGLFEQDNRQQASSLADALAKLAKEDGGPSSRIRPANE
jgi:phage terminase small subunit